MNSATTPRRRSAVAIDVARVRLVLGDDVIHAHRKDDIIAQLIANGWPQRERARWYRLWCEAVGVDVLRSDLRRVEKGSRREMNRPLQWATK